jgi:hypothetical protein
MTAFSTRWLCGGSTSEKDRSLRFVVVDDRYNAPNGACDFAAAAASTAAAHGRCGGWIQRDGCGPCHLGRLTTVYLDKQFNNDNFE